MKEEQHCNRVRTWGSVAAACVSLSVTALTGCGTNDPLIGPLGPVDAATDTGSSGSSGGIGDSGGVHTVGVDSGTDAGDGGPVATFSVGGIVSGLAGTGMVRQNNGGDDLTVNANGSFVFPTKLATKAAFAITVKTQPTAPTQTCTVTGGTGTIASGNVTSVVINCAVNT
ncbi:MAG TPA: hypothetical protein VM925_03325, partial [Labilithrix sp.]|nr:hypothetical protein [Labilithrix sp.]